jgi:hypothetical protein
MRNKGKWRKEFREGFKTRNLQVKKEERRKER